MVGVLVVVCRRVEVCVCVCVWVVHCTKEHGKRNMVVVRVAHNRTRRVHTNE